MCTNDLVVDRNKEQKQDRIVSHISILLELSAADDLEGFRSIIEQEDVDVDVDGSGLWYGRSIGSKKMRLEERTPLMIASMFGSKHVLKFILGLNHANVNKSCGSDRATALHMAVAGGSSSCVEVVKLLIDASADTNCLDVQGNRPVDLLPLVFGSSFNSKRKLLELVLNGDSDSEELRVLSQLIQNEYIKEQKDPLPHVITSSRDLTEKKEYPVDLSLPDMKNGIYNTDEFRMYTFKIKPCSRAYSHDWTECPFVHPGENARRRDPRKYHYSCVPCPEFRKGSCRQGDACEYAHGIFECWLHPAQYRTRLCKDEIGCNRKVCFFAHKPEELRPLHPSTGSAVLSPRSLSSDISSLTPFSLGSPSIIIPPNSTPPITPLASSPRNVSLWSNQSSPTPKVLSSRFKTTPNMDLEAEFMRVDRYRQQQLIDNFSNLSPPSTWNNYLEEYEIPTNLELLANQNMNYSSGFPSSPLRMSSPSSFGPNQIMNSRSTAFAKRSQSFIDRGTSAVNRQSTMAPSNLSDWSSPDGKLNWGIQKEELNKLRKSASFGVRSTHATHGSPDYSSNRDPDFPFSVNGNQLREPGNGVTFDEEQHFSPWVEQLYMEQEQLVA